MSEQAGWSGAEEIVSKSERLPVPRRSRNAPLKVDVAQSITNTTRLTVNVSQDVHVTTRDKIELALRKTLPSYVDVGSFLGPLGVFLALFVGLVTADFRTMFGVGDDVWKALFIVGSGVSVVWAIRNFVRFLKRSTLDDIVEAVVAEAEEP
ncbi:MULTISPECIES: hypothetical protein [unclassified Micromonospora]|uniref:hypothetical protein n=1 Tax=unclassified Micromonospora TaxID=2617518 RepID=UPI0011269EEC|nr:MULTISPECIES: hypothetical protein [unclassified Micromonospora]MCK1805269.1 hypothetical protein [Micromonospora sp. R42106]MCK1834069.1 hypothetical protein [Micromonospora sp. R42003]MCK1842063.1 hypothetical protein [Micromonospora sp. R42004]MCM1015321.1 hypothetical protein [Micromonospora sp. XM-20-01]